MPNFLFSVSSGLRNGTFSRSFAALALGFLVSVASAQTLVVDDSGGPGVDYLTIQGAVDAAPEGAVLLVRDGDYSPFTLNKGLTIVGAGSGTRVYDSFPPIQIRGLVSASTAVISRMGTRRIEVADCAGTVVLDELDLDAFSAGLSIVGCEDVRCSGIQRGFIDVGVRDSRVQLSRCLCRNIFVQGTSVAHVSRCTVIGREGDNCETIGCLFDGTEVPDGGTAIFVGPDAYLRIVDSIAIGGSPGFNVCGCSGIGSRGRSCVVQGIAEVWNTRTSAGGPLITVDTVAGGVFNEMAPFPSLDTTGSGAPGTLVGFEVSAPPGTSARFILGRGPDRAPIPNSAIGRLVQASRLASLGEVPANGTFSLGFNQPGFPPGTIIWAQMSATSFGGQTELSNAVAFIIPQ